MLLSSGFIFGPLITLCFSVCVAGESEIEPCRAEGSVEECSATDVTSLLHTSHVVKHRGDLQKRPKPDVLDTWYIKENKHTIKQDGITYQDLALSRGDSSVMLLGTLVFVMGIFYMVNSPMEPVRENTWAMITCSISIFCAVMLRDLVGKVIDGLLGVHEDVRGVRPASSARLGAAASQMLMFWLFILGLLYLKRTSKLGLKGYGIIGGHFMSFASIDLYGTLALTPTFRSSCVMTLLIIPIYFAGQSLLILLYEKCETWMLARGYLTEEEDADLDKQVHDTEQIFFCIGLGFILCYFTRFFICSQSPAIHVVSEHHTQGEIEMLAVIGIAKMFFSGSFNVLSHKFHHSAILQRVMDGVATSIAASAAFCLLWCANWYFYDSMGTGLHEHLMVALLMTIVGAWFIVFMSFFLHHGEAEKEKLQSAFTAVSLGVGLSWQETFESAMGNLKVYDHEDTPVATIMFLVIVLPAWMLYIMPRGDEELERLAEEQKHKHRDSTLCCCGDPFQTEEDSATDSSEDEEQQKKRKGMFDRFRFGKDSGKGKVEDDPPKAQDANSAGKGCASCLPMKKT